MTLRGKESNGLKSYGDTGVVRVWRKILKQT